MTATIAPLAPIARNDTGKWIATLDRGFRQRSIVTIFGPSGSGKSWLLNHWVRGGSKIVQADQVVCVRLRRAVGKALPMTCIVFSRLRYQLLRLAEPSYLVTQGQDQEEPILYTERHLASLFNIVLTLLGKLPIRAIAIDNAHLLDEKAIEWLLDLRMENDPHYETAPRRALIFAAQARPKEVETCSLTKHLTEIEEAMAGWREQIVLDHLKGAAFIEVLAKLFKENLQAEFSDDLDVDKLAGELWKLTRGNWWGIARLANIFYEELEALNRHSPRIITRVVVEGMRKRLAELPK